MNDIDVFLILLIFTGVSGLTWLWARLVWAANARDVVKNPKDALRFALKHPGDAMFLILIAGFVLFLSLVCFPLVYSHLGTASLALATTSTLFYGVGAIDKRLSKKR